MKFWNKSSCTLHAFRIPLSIPAFFLDSVDESCRLETFFWFFTLRGFSSHRHASCNAFLPSTHCTHCPSFDSTLTLTLTGTERNPYLLLLVLWLHWLRDLISFDFLTQPKQPDVCYVYYVTEVFNLRFSRFFYPLYCHAFRPTFPCLTRFFGDIIVVVVKVTLSWVET